MTYLDEIEQALSRPTPPSTADVLRMLARAAGELAEWRRQARDTLRAFDDRITLLERERNRAARVTQLPSDAPRGALLMLVGDAEKALYVGQGAGSPLVKYLPALI